MILQVLKTQFGGALESAQKVGRELRLRVGPQTLVSLARACKQLGFTYPADITAVDTGAELRLVYRLVSFAAGQQIVITVGAPRSGARLPTLADLYHGAEWTEREVYDLFGVTFDGHPDLRRILLTDDWEGHPLLKSSPPPAARAGARPAPPPVAPVRDLTQTLTPTERVVLNMGPQHPSTHGVLRLELTLEGEVVVGCRPIIGYLHRGVEKIGEARTYPQLLPYTDRLDYLSSASNNLAYVQAVEKLMGLEVPERAQYLRVILLELNRIASHLLFVSTFANDLAATTVFLYGLREREYVMDLFELWAGARLTQSWIRVGGVPADLPDGFLEKARQFCHLLPGRLDEYDRLLTGNRIFRVRTEGIGILPPEEAVDYACSGPTLRGSGVRYDVRRAEPYEAYPRLDFEVVTAPTCDCMGRYLVRMGELRQSLRILRQCLDQLPAGEVMAKVPRLLRPPAGEAYGRVESPRGDFGCFVVSDGGPQPVRVRFRAPSFFHLAALPRMLLGWKIGDVVAILGSIDVVLGEVDR